MQNEPNKNTDQKTLERAPRPNKIKSIDDLLARKAYRDRLQAFIKQAQNSQSVILNNYNEFFTTVNTLEKLITTKTEQLKQSNEKLNNKIENNKKLLNQSRITQNTLRSEIETAKQNLELAKSASTIAQDTLKSTEQRLNTLKLPKEKFLDSMDRGKKHEEGVAAYEQNEINDLEKDIANITAKIARITSYMQPLEKKIEEVIKSYADAKTPEEIATATDKLKAIPDAVIAAKYSEAEKKEEELRTKIKEQETLYTAAIEDRKNANANKDETQYKKATEALNNASAQKTKLEEEYKKISKIKECYIIQDRCYKIKTSENDPQKAPAPATRRSKGEPTTAEIKSLPQLNRELSILNEKLTKLMTEVVSKEAHVANIKNFENKISSISTHEDLEKQIAKLEEDVKTQQADIDKQTSIIRTNTDIITAKQKAFDAEVAQQTRLEGENSELQVYVSNNSDSLTLLEQSFSETSNQKDKNYSKLLNNFNDIKLMQQYFTSNIEQNIDQENTTGSKKLKLEQTQNFISNIEYIMALIVSFFVKEPRITNASQLIDHENALGIARSGQTKDSMKECNESITKQLQSIEVKTIAETTNTNALKPDNKPHSSITPQRNEVSERSKVSEEHKKSDHEDASLNHDGSLTSHNKHDL